MMMLFRSIRSAALSVGFLLFAAPVLTPQQTTHSLQSHEVNFAFPYTAQRSNTTGGNSFWMQGGNAQVVGTVFHGLGAVADVTATRASKINGTNVNLTLVTTTFGPRYTWVLPASKNSSQQLRLFGEVTGGIVNSLDSAFPDLSGVQSNAAGTALQVVAVWI